MKTYCLTNPPQKHPDIRRLQTALKAPNFYHGPIDGIFGRSTGDACYRAKYALGYPRKEVNRCGGQQLLNYLSGTQQLPLAFRVRRKQRGYGISKEEAMREKIVAFALWGVANKGQIHYNQSRPMDHLHNVKALPWWSDCSENVTTYYCWAGAPDPNGHKYNGLGWTGDMLDHGKTIALYQAKPADLIIFGSHPGVHVVVLLENGSANHGDPEISSHGQESGPSRYRLSVEAAYQPKVVTVKRYIGI